MPSTESDPPGDACRVLVAVYLAVPVVGAVAVGLAARGTTLQTGAVVVLLGGLATLALVGGAVGLRGVPRPLRPRRLYPSGWSWLSGQGARWWLWVPFRSRSLLTRLARRCSRR